MSPSWAGVRPGFSSARGPAFSPQSQAHKGLRSKGLRFPLSLLNALSVPASRMHGVLRPCPISSTLQTAGGISGPQSPEAGQPEWGRGREQPQQGRSASGKPPVCVFGPTPTTKPLPKLSHDPRGKWVLPSSPPLQAGNRGQVSRLLSCFSPRGAGGRREGKRSPPPPWEAVA